MQDRIKIECQIIFNYPILSEILNYLFQAETDETVFQACVYYILHSPSSQAVR